MTIIGAELAKDEDGNQVYFRHRKHGVLPMFSMPKPSSFSSHFVNEAARREYENASEEDKEAVFKKNTIPVPVYRGMNDRVAKDQANTIRRLKEGKLVHGYPSLPTSEEQNDS